MLAQALLVAVERDLSVARQLAHYHVELTTGGCIRSADDVTADESGAMTNPFHFATSSAAFPLQPHHRNAPPAVPAAHSSSFAQPPAGTARCGGTCSSAAVPLRVALSNAVQRPRQGTCAVLMELSRPLPWLSQRGRYRGSAVTGGARGTAGSTATMNASGGAALNTAASGGAAGAAGGHGTGNTAATGASVGGAASVSAGGGAVGGLHTSNPISAATAASPSATSASAPSVPLLIATATLEVVFPARYPSESCHWQLSEEVSLGGMGDHSTSSWAVTAGHNRGNTTGISSGNKSCATGSISKLPPPHHTHSSVGGLGNSRAWYGGGGPTAGEDADPTAAGDSAGVPTLTAFVVPEVGRRLLRWIAEARLGAEDPCTPTSRSSSHDGWGGEVDPSQQHGRGTRLHHCDVSPFLLDLAVLLRCWSTVEMDVHHLLLPSRIAMAFSGGGTARLLRAMTGTHLSGGAAAGTAVAGVAGAGAGGGGGGGGPHTSAGAPLQTVGLPGGGVSGAAAVGSGGGATSSTASVPAQSSGSGGLGPSAGSGGGLGAVTGGGGVGSASSAVTVLSGGVGSVVGGAAATPSAAAAAAAAAAGMSALYPYRRRPAKGFMALLLPLGEVAVWGTPRPARRAVHAADSGAAAAAESQPPHRRPLVLRHLYESALQDAVKPTTVTVSCTTQFIVGKVLPTYVLPCHVLGTPYKCEWDAVRLFTGRSADAALHAQAKLAKAVRLPDVSDLMQVLRRLSRNVGTPSTGVLYVGAVVWPALMEAVRVLRDERRPFWAGLAACSLLLPGVLQQDCKANVAEGGSRSRGCASLSIVPDESVTPATYRRRHLAELIEVVTYTEHVLAIAQEHTLLCEARLVRCALQRGLHLVQRCSHAAVGPHTTTIWPKVAAAAAAAVTSSGMSSQGAEHATAAGAAVPASAALTALTTPFTPIVIASADMCRRLHAPITICAVCGLSLLSSTVTTADVSSGGASAGGSTRTPSHTDAVRLTIQARRVEGCLVVQCARCGHGGHVEHISSWWNDPTVRCCPKGCDCRCTY